MSITQATIKHFANSLDTFSQSGDNRLIEKQKVAYGTLAPALRQGFKEGVYDIATGVGKTVLFTHFIKAFTSTPPAGKSPKPTRVLILVPKVPLVKQTVESLAEFAPEYFPNYTSTGRKPVYKDINLDDSKVGTYFQDRKDTDRPVLVATYQSFVEDQWITEGGVRKSKPMKDRIFKPENFELLILDEAHRTLGKETFKALEQFEDKTLRLGFSATTEYSKDKTVANLLKRTLCTIDVAEAHDDKLLTPFGCYIVNTGLNIDKSKIEITKKKGGRDFNEAQLAQALNRRERNLKAVRLYMNWADPHTGERLFGQTGILACVDTTHAKDVAELFRSQINEAPAFRQWLQEEALIRAARAREAGNEELAERFEKEGIQVCAALDYKTPKEERDQLIEDHRNGKLLMMAGVNIPSEGYDNQAASVLISLRDTLSLVKEKQTGGRVLRLDQLNLWKYGRIFEFRDNEKYIEDVGADKAPIFYAETLSPDFKFRSSADAWKDKPGGDGPHEPLPPPIIDDDVFKTLDVEEPDKVLDSCNLRRTERRKAMANKDRWLNCSDLAKAFYVDDDAASWAVFKEIIAPYSDVKDKISLPSDEHPTPMREYVVISNFGSDKAAAGDIHIHPELLDMKWKEVARKVYEKLKRHSDIEELPADMADWVCEDDLEDLARQKGLKNYSAQKMAGFLDDLFKDEKLIKSKATIKEGKVKDNTVITSLNSLLVQTPDGKFDSVPFGEAFAGPFFKQGSTGRFISPLVADTLVQCASDANDDRWKLLTSGFLPPPAIADLLQQPQTPIMLGQISEIMKKKLESIPDSERKGRGLTQGIMQVPENLSSYPLWGSSRMFPEFGNSMRIPIPVDPEHKDWLNPYEIARQLRIPESADAIRNINTFLERNRNSIKTISLGEMRAGSLGGEMTNHKLFKLIAGPFIERTGGTGKSKKVEILYRANPALLPNLASAFKQSGAIVEITEDQWQETYAKGYTCATDFFKRLERTPTADELKRLKESFAKQKDKHGSLGPYFYDGHEQVFISNSPDNEKRIAAVMKLFPPLPKHLKERALSVDGVIAKVGSNSLGMDYSWVLASDEAIQYCKDLLEQKTGYIVGQHTRGDYSGPFYNPEVVTQLKEEIKRWKDSHAGKKMKSYFQISEVPRSLPASAEITERGLLNARVTEARIEERRASQLAEQAPDVAAPATPPAENTPAQIYHDDGIRSLRKNGRYYDTVDAMAEKLKVTPDKMSSLVNIIEALHTEMLRDITLPMVVSIADGEGFKPGHYVNHLVQKEIAKRLQAIYPDTDKIVLAQQQKPLSVLLNGIDPYALRDKIKGPRLAGFFDALAKNPDTEFLVSDFFSDKFDVATLRGTPTGSAKKPARVLLSDEIDVTKLGDAKIHPTLYPYLFMAMGGEPSTSTKIRDYAKLLPAPPKEWIAINAERPDDRLKPLGKLSGITPIISDWAATNAMVDTPDGRKPAIGMMALCADPGSVGRPRYFIDPQLIPALQVEITNRKGTRGDVG